MSKKTKNPSSWPTFTLREIPAFDARRGTRCIIPGVGVSIVGRRGMAVADFWIDPYDQFVMRISCPGELTPLHCIVGLANYAALTEVGDYEDFSSYIEAVLLGWLSEGNEHFAVHEKDPYLLQAFIDGSLHLLDKINADKGYLWENDHFLIPMTHQRELYLKTMNFKSFRSRGLCPEKAFPSDRKLRNEYTIWMESNLK